MSAAAAFFDVDGTLVDRHIVHQFLHIRRRMLPRIFRPFWTGAFLAKVPYYVVLDKVSRTRLNVAFYRNYAGLSAESVRARVRSCFEEVIRPSIYAEVEACLEAHRSAGRRIVLVTGSIDFIIAPLAEHFRVDACFAPSLVQRGDRFTGELNGPPIGSTEKARRVREYAGKEHIDLASSYAYGDSIADLPMLESVGNPHVVNPDRSLAAAAERLGWPRLDWTLANGKHAVR